MLQNFVQVISTCTFNTIHTLKFNITLSKQIFSECNDDSIEYFLFCSQLWYKTSIRCVYSMDNGDAWFWRLSVRLHLQVQVTPHNMHTACTVH